MEDRSGFLAVSLGCERASFEGTFPARAHTPPWFSAVFSCGRTGKACVLPLTGL